MWQFHSCYFSIFANFVYCGSHTRLTVPIRPSLCLAMMISADSFILGIFVVIIITVDKHYHIGILLDGSGLTQVGKHRSVIRTLLHGSATAGTVLPPAHSALWPALLRTGKYPKSPADGSPNFCRTAGHQLQVVDDDQLQIMLQLVFSAFASQLRDRDTRRIINDQIRNDR